MRSIAQLIEGQDTEWVTIANNFIKDALRKGQEKRERKWWEPSCALLLDLEIHILGSATLRGMLKGWVAAKGTLLFAFRVDSLPKDTMID